MKIVFPGLEKTKVNGINLKRRREEVLEDPELDRGGSRSQHREHHNLQFNIIKMPGLVLCISTHPHSFSDAFSMSDGLPSLDSLQDALDSLKTSSSDPKTRSNAIKLLERIAMGLCQVISPR